MTVDAEDARSRAVWARVDDGFYVGSRGGDFLGYVDRRDDGRFVAADLHSHPLGVFDDLASARSSVEQAAPIVTMKGSESV